MVDASVGGKLGVNFQGLKNQIGSFSNPKSVIINPKFFGASGVNTPYFLEYRNGNTTKTNEVDTKIALNLFEDLKYDLKGIRSGALVKPIYLSKLPKDLKKLKSTQKKKDTFIKIVMPLILDENNKILENRKKLFKILSKQNNSRGEKVWLKRRFEDYGIKNEDVMELKIRMDIVRSDNPDLLSFRSKYVSFISCHTEEQNKRKKNFQGKIFCPI